MFRYSLKRGKDQSFQGVHLSSKTWYNSKNKIQGMSNWDIVLEENFLPDVGTKIKDKSITLKTKEEIDKYEIKKETLTTKIMKKTKSKIKGVDKNAK